MKLANNSNVPESILTYTWTVQCPRTDSCGIYLKTIAPGYEDIELS